MEAKGTAIRLPCRSATLLMPSPRATSDSAAPIRSWIQITFMSISSGALSAFAAGALPSSPTSRLFAPKAWMTSPPEANLLHTTFTLGMHVLSRLVSLTIRSPFGISCQPIRTVPRTVGSGATGHGVLPPIDRDCSALPDSTMQPEASSPTVPTTSAVRARRVRRFMPSPSTGRPAGRST
ncbi:hypothetical protein AXK61_10305 [Tsukamurella pseudospumae]|uniref:Uncharacterized protein n=1 Tax=Tsukamurella pseudospumae TaxID=239498 RepID=A0A137YSW9_9ACTN|nr:hypothetical protein AXK61_10305 [Tsukamurella pseudospumae]